MKQIKQRLVIVWLLMVLLCMPVLAQDAAPPDVVPTAESTPPLTPQPVDGEGNSTVLDWLTFVIENDLHWYFFALIGLFVAGNLVPAAEIERRRERARQTETPVDDAMVSFLEAVQMMKQMLGGMNVQPALTPPTPAQSGSYVEELKKLNVPAVDARTGYENLRQIGVTPAQPSPPTPLPHGEGSKPTVRVIRQELDVPVNANPNLNVLDSGHGNWGGEDRRAKDVPDTYQIVWQPFMAGDNFSPAPEIHKQDTGLDVAMAHRRGRLFFFQDVTGKVLPGQRYLLAVRVQCDLKLKADADLKGAIAIRGQILNGEAVIRNLHAWSPENVEDLRSGFNALWAIETERVYGNLSYQVLVEVGNVHAVPFDDLSKIVITAIELIPVASDYGNENLVRF